MRKTILYCADGTWNGPPADPLVGADIGVAASAPDALAAVTTVYKVFNNLEGTVTAEIAALPNEQEKTFPDAAGSPVQVEKYLSLGFADRQWV